MDKFRLYRGGKYPITEHIMLYVPLLDEVADYGKIYLKDPYANGEQEFFSMAYNIVAEPVDLKWQLWDMGIDWTEIKPFDLFCAYIAPTLNKDSTRIFFGDVLDFSAMRIIKGDDEQIRLVQHVVDSKNPIIKEKVVDVGTFVKKKGVVKEELPNEYDIVIDRFVYRLMCDVIREICGIPRCKDKPKNEVTKIAQIEDAKDEYFRNRNKPYVSVLFNLVSTLVNCDGFKRDDKTVFDMNLYAFMDSVRRISKIKTSFLLLQSGYSGFGVDLKKIGKDEIDWMGDL